MNRRHILFVLFLSALCLSCINKKTAENENTLTTENIDELEISSTTEKVYVVPLEGLNLRSTYSITGTIIRLLPQNTELIVLERSDEKETIDGLLDYWYMVDTGEETGWVFGGYLELMVSGIPIEFIEKNWNSRFGSLSPIENFTIGDLQSCSWQRNDTILIFSREGNYAGLSRGGYNYGRYVLENNTVHFIPPLNIVRFAEEYSIVSLHYSNEMYYEGTPVLKNDDETVLFSANNSTEAKVGEIVKLHQHYCEKIWERGRINTNGILYSLPDVSSKNMFQDDYYGRKATEIAVVKLAKTKIDDVVWYYTLFDFTSGEPIDGGGPFYDGWLPEKYFE
ncbi:MAG: SH3 domain-containing protein [Treponema sp.]|jgi:hypothetical protein|nr:SH3 domain-containing protein [Treponema sp.]